MSDLVQIAIAALSGGGAVAAIGTAWIRARSGRAAAGDHREQAREDRVEHLETALDQQRRELASLVALRIDDNERCAEMLAAAIASAKTECAGQIAAVEARADRIVEEIVTSLIKRGAVRPDDTGVHHVVETIAAGRRRRTTPPQAWSADQNDRRATTRREDDRDDESGGER